MNIPGPGRYQLANGYRADLRENKSGYDPEIAFVGQILDGKGYAFHGEWMKNGNNVSGSSIAERKQLSVVAVWSWAPHDGAK